MPNESGVEQESADKPTGTAHTNTTIRNSDLCPPSFSDELEIKKEKISKPHLKFILGTHGTREDAEKAVGAVEDCDIIAMEAVGGDAEVRRIEQAFWQEIMDEPRDSQRSKELLSLINESIEKEAGATEFDYYFAKGIAGTGKTILLIDISEENPQFYLKEKSTAAMAEYVTALEEEEGLQSILVKLRSSIDAQTESYKSREALVLEQLREIGDRFKGRDDLSIGVFEGTVHTSPSHTMHSYSHPLSREFTQTNHRDKKGIGQRMFSWHDQAVRQKLFFPDKPLTDNFLKRVIISDLLAMDGTPAEESKSMDIALEKMPEDEVDELLFSELYTLPLFKDTNS